MVASSDHGLETAEHSGSRGFLKVQQKPLQRGDGLSKKPLLGPLQCDGT